MFAKLFFTLLAIVAVWLGFKYYARFIAGPARRRAMERPREAVSERRERRETGGGVEDMMPCAVCGAYVPARGTPRCGRPDCPF